MRGKLIYLVSEGENKFKSLRLTICSEGDRPAGGLVELRRSRLIRLMEEASSQGAKLTYKDLGMILLSSKATLKRDVSHLRGMGIDIRMKGFQGGESDMGYRGR